ncbi:MAG TPA: ATP-dependent DNA helicase [Planctomycetota bacterium]|jgi:DNA excision repair protein ERCC-2
MAVRVDLDQKTIHAAIRDLIEPPEDSRSIGIPLRLRAELGRQVHRRYGEASATGTFTPEVSVALERTVDGFAAQLQGQLDGLIDTGDTLIVEEVKSVTLTGPELRAATPQAFPDYCLQLLLYALSISLDRPGRRVRARLVLCSLHNRAQRVLEVPFDPAATLARLDELLRAAIREAEERRRRAVMRDESARRLTFPYFSLRPHQQQLMDAMAEGLAARRPVLAMAPTGLGKTVSALLAGLRFSLARDATLFYATAKRTQQQLVSRTFEDICAASGLHAGTVAAVTLRARERMCPPGHLMCNVETCPFLKDFGSRLAASRVEDELLNQSLHVTPDAIYARGTALQLCPFRVSLRLAARAELVIGDYNYVYDGPPQERDDDERRSVVIVDEAHNLFDRAREYDSPFLAREAITECRKRIRSAPSRRRINPDQLLLPIAHAAPKPTLFTRLAVFFDRLIAYTDRRFEEAVECGLAFADGCAAVEPDSQTWRELAEQAAGLLVAYALHNRARKALQADDPVLAVLRAVLRLSQLLEEPAAEFVPFLAGPAAASGAGIGILCVNPANRLAQQHSKALGTIAMSATFTPLSYYRDVLGFSALDPLAVCVPSPFPPENREIVIVPTLDTSYRRRAMHYQAVAKLIADVVRVRPGCYAAYFPSFDFLEQVRPKIELPGAEVLVQTPSMSEDQRRQTLETMRSGAGVPARLLLAVMGGVLAEGIDLPGEALVGAIVIGPALPKPGFERGQMRRYFDESGRDGFAYAMLYPGMQRVIQAAGRVIRNMDDRGVIVLACRRFAEPTYADCLPADWRPDGIYALLAPQPAERLRAFWSGR